MFMKVDGSVRELSAVGTWHRSNTFDSDTSCVCLIHTPQLILAFRCPKSNVRKLVWARQLSVEHAKPMALAILPYLLLVLSCFLIFFFPAIMQ
jgi:hypothetical protein